MSINLGTEAIESLRTLRDSEAWAMFRAGLDEQLRKSMNAALDAPPDEREVALGYARALRDLHMALKSATEGVQLSRVDRPSPVQRRA